MQIMIILIIKAFERFRERFRQSLQLVWKWPSPGYIVSVIRYLFGRNKVKIVQENIAPSQLFSQYHRKRISYGVYGSITHT